MKHKLASVRKHSARQFDCLTLPRMAKADHQVFRLQAGDLRATASMHLFFI